MFDLFPNNADDIEAMNSLWEDIKANLNFVTNDGTVNNSHGYPVRVADGTEAGKEETCVYTPPLQHITNFIGIKIKNAFDELANA